jgi:hypothetical protein
MARTRSIKPSFFKNEFLAECEPMARLLFAGLWTLADSQGRLECRPLRIKAELFPYDNCDIVSLLGQLEARGFVVAYRVGDRNYLEIPTFTEHQRCHPSEQPEGIPAADTGEIVKIHGEQLKITAVCAFNPSSFNPSTSNPSSAPTTPAARARSKPADPLRWSAESGWEGITDADHAEWLQAYPAADLPVELAKAHQWLKANQNKAKKSNWRRWLTTVWLSKCQDRGGTHREAARSPASAPPVDQAKRRFFRSDAQRSMTDSEHAIWRREQRSGGTVAALASSITLKDEDT